MCRTDTYVYVLMIYVFHNVLFIASDVTNMK